VLLDNTVYGVSSMAWTTMLTTLTTLKTLTTRWKQIEPTLEIVSGLAD
jgi:hypothetical protein